MSRTLTADDLTAIRMICRQIILDLREETQPVPRPAPVATIDLVELQAVSRVAHAKGDYKMIQRYLNRKER
jgi:hypothetical protein